MARYIGDYEVIRELGSGHFGTVYLAVGETPARGRAPAKRRMVAIKKLRDSADERSVDLLLQEFALLEQVKHRGVVRVYEYIEHENAVVMEHIHGVTLRQVLEELSKAREQVFTEAAIEMGCELADALYQAWTTPGDNGEPLQLVHRDLKPANVMLTPQGEVKILDFGLARVDNADFAKDSGERIKGTPIYMAPEQARGEGVDHRTDLFALGLILYELLMREAAYTVPRNSRDPLSEVHRRIEAGDLREQCAELESRLPQLGPIVTRLLQRRPEDRYQGGHDVLVDLRRQLYRDRGAYLHEFCEFFFGSICEIGPAPSLDAHAGGGGRARSSAGSAPAAGGRGRRLSIEERLKQSMARENTARNKVGRAPERPGRPAPPPMPSSPAAGGRAAPPPPPGPGAPVPPRDNDDSRRRPVRPPVGGGASRAQTFTPGADTRAGGGRAPLRSVGGRSPDETGMLEMVPLSNDSDESEAAADPSATAFFAIPAPKADRSRPGGAGGPMPPPPMGGPSGVAPPMPGPPPAAGGFGAPPPPPGGFGAPPPGPPPAPGGFGAPAPGFGAPPTPMAPPQPMVQGPVASYGGPPGPAGGHTPFQVSGPTPGAAPSAEAEQRVQSTRLYAILFALFMLIGVAVVVAVWLRPSGDSGGEEVVADAATTAAPVVATTKKKKVSLDEDTGIAEPAPEPKRAPRRTTTSSGGTSSKPAAAAAPPPPAALATPAGNLVVSIADPSVSTSVEIVCPSNYRNRATFSGGKATLTGVPAESCTMFFKGGITQYRFGPVSGGKSVSCSVSGTAMVCR